MEGGGSVGETVSFLRKLAKCCIHDNQTIQLDILIFFNVEKKRNVVLGNGRFTRLSTKPNVKLSGGHKGGYWGYLPAP